MFTISDLLHSATKQILLLAKWDSVFKGTNVSPHESWMKIMCTVAAERILTSGVGVGHVSHCRRCSGQALKTVPDAARCRQEAVVIFYARMARPKQRFGHILSRLTMPELLVVAHRLGWRNIISWHLPDLSYKFFLNRPDEYECAERLAKMAVRVICPCI